MPKKKRHHLTRISCACGKHCNGLTETAVIIRAVERERLTFKVTLRPVRGQSCGQRKLQFTDAPTGLTVRIKGGTGFQEVHVDCEPEVREAICQTMRAAWVKKRW